jgi:hypothetical protein
MSIGLILTLAPLAVLLTLGFLCVLMEPIGEAFACYYSRKYVGAAIWVAVTMCLVCLYIGLGVLLYEHLPRT